MHYLFMACPKCGALDTLKLDATPAAHDNNLIDVIITCDEADDDGCGVRLNGFLNINEMTVLE